MGTKPQPAKGFQGKLRWPLVRIGEVATLHYGRALTASSRRPGDVRVYGSNGQCGWHDTPIGPGPTVVLGRKGQGPLGVEWCPWPFWVIDTAYHVTVDSQRIDLRYFYFLTKFIGLNHLKDGTSNPSLSRDVFGRQNVPLPPLPVQRRIAGILSAYDELIENSQRRIKILEAMARALYREWFVHFRFPGHENHPRVASPLGEIPKGWEVRLVKDILARRAAGTVYREADAKREGAIPVLDQSINELLGFHDKAADHLASPDSPLAIFGDHTCKMRLLVEPFSIGPNVVPFAAVAPLPTAYIFYAVNSLVQTQEYKRHWAPLNAKEVIVADSVVARRFASIIQPMLGEQEILRKEIRNLRRTRDLLLPRLLSGQIDVEAA